MAEGAKPEPIGDILLRIERLLIKIADQMDIELSEAENTVAVLRKPRRQPCPCHAAKPAENKAVG